MSAGRGEAGDRWRAWLRWGGAAAIVLAAHAVGAWVLVRQQQPVASTGEAGPAILVELAPLPVAPAAAQIERAPTPDAEPEPAPEPPETTADAAPPEPQMPPLPDVAKPVFEEPEPAPVETTQLPPPPPPPVKEPDVVLPEPRPVEKKTPPKPPVREAKKQPERPRRPEPTKERKASKPRAESAAAASPSQAPAAPTRGTSESASVSPANWRGAVSAHLNRAKRYPAEARQRREEGTVRLSFVIDRSGRVLSYKIVGSSGSAAIDEEAIAMIQRASPLPAPPAEVAGAQIPLTVPLQFYLR
ncbi:energy transducer TonB [Microvirga rosea]|uniref:energy transducer TonB n=1 Tax=Microvirga rosea TaxID=2715425 RepID=UPI001D09B5DE|nr:energy transducer TonB [Microvirga rosea]MCB8821821.1 energy transducer TonB [Microvirga rosea]